MDLTVGCAAVAFLQPGADDHAKHFAALGGAVSEARTTRGARVLSFESIHVSMVH